MPSPRATRTRSIQWMPLADVVGHGLLEIDVEAPLHGGDEGQRVPVGRRGEDPVGVQGIQILLATPDAAAYAYNGTRELSELYLVEELK
jgi:hypothetical protein